MKKIAFSSIFFLCYFTLYGQHPDLGLNGQVTWLSDTKIRVEYDWSSDAQLADWYTTNGSRLVRGMNMVTISGGVVSVRSMVWKQPVKCTRILAQDAKAINASRAHLNFVTNVGAWTGLQFNPAETIGVIYMSNGNNWIENTVTQSFSGPNIVLGTTYTTEINISETSITTKLSIDNVVRTRTLSNPPDPNREVAIGGWGGDTQWGKLTIEGEITLPVPVPADMINIQSTGSSFSPVLEVTGNPVIEWIFADGTTSSSRTPVKSYGSIGSRHNFLKVTPWSALTGINVGYDAGDSGYGGFPLVANQYVSGFKNLNLAKSNLRYLCASYSPVSEIDLREMAALEFVELLYCSNLEKLQLGSHPKLERLCTEDCNLAALDLSGCTALGDLRSASNNYTSINWGTIGASLWHICVRSTAFTQNLPALTQFPALRELLIWNDNQTGALTIHSTAIQMIEAYNNSYTSADVSGCTSLRLFNLSGNPLTSLNLGTAGSMNEVRLKDCNLSQSLVDYVLLTIDQNSRINGTLDLTGNSSPSSTGITNLNNLKGKGWTVNIGSGTTSIDSWYIEPPRMTVNTSEVRIFLNENMDSWKSGIYNLNGILLAEKLVKGDVLIIDISSYRPGVYMIQFSNGSRKKVTRFVKP